MPASEQTITQILWANGYGHRPTQDGRAHAIFSFNTMEVVAYASAHTVLKTLGLAA